MLAYFVSLPDGVKVGITAVVLAVVSFLLAKLIALVPFLKFLEAYRESLAMGIAIALIEAIQNAVPDAYAPIAVLALELVLAVLALLGVGNQMKRQGILG